MRKLLLLAGFLAAALGAQTGAVPSYKTLKYPPLRPIRLPDVATSTLPSGMKLYLLENHELPLVRGVALVRTGNLFDPPDKVGLATVTGMVMRTGGTAAQTGDELDEALENVAASVESQIQETHGQVTFSTLKENTDQVLAIFHDVLSGPAFRENKIVLAKTELRSSIARRNDDPHGISEREFSDLVYGKKTPYGWRMEYDTVDRITRDDLQAFYRRYFFPANVMLAVQGDFSIPEMKARLEKLFADWTPNEAVVPPFPPVRTQPAPGVYLAAKSDVTQTFFDAGHLGGILRDKDYPALEVMADILGDGFRSRLFQRVRTQLGYAYSISGFWGSNFQHPGLFQISGSTKSESTLETLRVIREEIEKMRTAEVTTEELESAKQAVANSSVFNFDTPAKTLNRVLFYDYYGYPRDFINQYLEGIQRVTKADILRVAREHLRPKDLSIVAVGNPKEFGKPLTALGLPVTPIDLTIPVSSHEPAAVSDGAGRRP